MKERGRLGRETNCEVREGRDNAGLENTRSQTEREIKRDQEKGDTDTTDKQTDGRCEQSAIILHLTGKSTNTNSKPSTTNLPPHRDSTISPSQLVSFVSAAPQECTVIPLGCVKHHSIPSLSLCVSLCVLPSNSRDLIFPSRELWSCINALN